MGGFYRIGVYEVLMRSWRTEQRVLRPKLRMLAHTGFIYGARRFRETGPDLAREISESSNQLQVYL